MKKTLVILFAGALLAAGSAFAQFPSLPGLGKIGGGGGASAGPDLGAQQDSLVRGYVRANKDVLTANALMGKALGLQGQAVDVQATADQLQEGATKDSLEAANKAVATSTDAVAAKLAEGPALDATSKATYAAGLASLASGALKYIGVGKEVASVGSNLKTASPMTLPKLGSAVYVVSKFPDAFSSVMKGLQNAVDFARKHDIPVPADATAALSSNKS